MTASTPSNDVRSERLARVLDRDVAPFWHDRFSQMLFRWFVPKPDSLALDIHCESGRTTAELLRRSPESVRVMGLTNDPAQIRLAKARIHPDWKQRVYFRPGDFDDVLAMDDDTYDLTIGNVVLTEKVAEWKNALAELLRITKPGGRVMVTLPIRGTWREAEDLLDELFVQADLEQPRRTLQRFRQRRPDVREIANTLEALGVNESDYMFEHEEFQLLFSSGREFLFSPIIEHGPLPLWKAIIGDSKTAQKLFWRLKEAIDTYFGDRVFAVSISAAVLVISLPDNEGASEQLGMRYWKHFPELSKVLNAQTLNSPKRDDHRKLSQSLAIINEDAVEDLFDQAFDLDDPDVDQELAGDVDGDVDEFDLDFGEQPGQSGSNLHSELQSPLASVHDEPPKEQTPTESPAPSGQVVERETLYTEEQEQEQEQEQEPEPAQKRRRAKPLSFPTELPKTTPPPLRRRRKNT